MAPDGGKTSDFADQSAARKRFTKMEQDHGHRRPERYFEYIKAFPPHPGDVAM